MEEPSCLRQVQAAQGNRRLPRSCRVSLRKDRTKVLWEPRGVCSFHLEFCFTSLTKPFQEHENWEKRKLAFYPKGFSTYLVDCRLVVWFRCLWGFMKEKGFFKASVRPTLPPQMDQHLHCLWMPSLTCVLLCVLGTSYFSALHGHYMFVTKSHRYSGSISSVHKVTHSQLKCARYSMEKFRNKPFIAF